MSQSCLAGLPGKSSLHTYKTFCCAFKSEGSNVYRDLLCWDSQEDGMSVRVTDKEREPAMCPMAAFLKKLRMDL